MAASWMKQEWINTKCFHQIVKISRHKLVLRTCSTSSLDKIEYVDSPQYPPIRDHSKKGNKRHERQLWYDSIKKMPTVEQKLLEITSKERRLVTYLNPGCLHYNALPHRKFYTKTRLIHGLPDKFQTSEIFDSEYESIRNRFLSNFKLEYEHLENLGIKSKPQEYIVRHIGRRAYSHALSTIMSTLANQYSHLMKAQVNMQPRCESFWWKGNIFSDKRWSRKNEEFMDICFQFVDDPIYQIRVDEPLLPIVSLEDPMCKYSEEHVPNYQFNPYYDGHQYGKCFVTSVPGVWPSSKYRYPFMSLNTMHDVAFHEKKFGKGETDENLDGLGILTSFGWLMGIATNLGFTPFHELTYPLVTQTIFTNGQEWAFFIYQLNTVCLHSDVDNGLLQNLCWSSGRMKLFESIENGEIKGLNEDVFKILYRFFINRPYYTHGMDMTPYLGEDTRTVEERLEMRAQLRQCFDNRPNARREKDEEIPLWKRIYKLHPKARPAPWLK